MTSWLERLAAAGLRGPAGELAERHFKTVAHQHAAVFGRGEETRAWWVPGRIEVLGKHTDYGGGRSLLCAVERGFHVIASPRADATVQISDASTNASVTIPFSADAEPRPGHWTDYPISVIRRVARDFPGASTGMNLMLRSSLPSASGLSSSSAMVIATFLPLAAINELRGSAQWTSLADNDDVAGYVGAMENGRAFGGFAADRGVGTQGGSEDQTAIIQSVQDHLLQYHFIPVTREGVIPIPAGWQFVIGMSGVHAAKGGAVQARYNGLAGEIARLLGIWQRATGRPDESLFQAMQSSPHAAQELAELIRHDLPGGDALRQRLTQFVAETEEIIPAVATRLRDGDVAGIGELVARSQAMAEETLGNQIAETVHLAARAVPLGAAAASAFGAGFGGSVWALVREAEAEAFAMRWRDDYLARFPTRRSRAEFFPTRAGPAATEI